MGYDTRIGFQFLHPGPGYGGSCFPKDVAALLHISASNGYDFDLLAGVVEVNEKQHERMIEKVRAAVGGTLAGVTVGVWGLTFKADTDDLRDSPAIYVSRRLLEEGAIVRAFDPGAGDRPRSLVPGIELCADLYDAVAAADALAVLTEWDEFRWADFDRVRSAMRGSAIVDARNLLDPAAMRRRGFDYQGVGRR
jgi:UDPglucose 6-dehydrogenase